MRSGNKRLSSTEMAHYNTNVPAPKLDSTPRKRVERIQENQ